MSTCSCMRPGSPPMCGQHTTRFRGLALKVRLFARNDESALATEESECVVANVSDQGEYHA